MSDLEVRDRLQEVFRLILEQPDLELAPDLRMGEVPSWDSFAHINLMLAIEAEFGVEFDSDEIGTLLSVREISVALTRHLERGRP